jgi:hypothetical protein
MNKYLIFSFIHFIFFLLFIITGLNAQELTKKWYPGHYATVNSESGIGDTNPFLIEPVKDNPFFVGYKFLIKWSSFEIEKDVWDWTKIHNALAVCERDNKVLMLTLVDVSHTGGTPPFPAYILTDVYEGGYYLGSGDRKKIFPKIWLPQYLERWNNFISKLGEEFDSNPMIAAINFAESARDRPVGVTETEIANAFKSQNAAAVAAFPNTIVFQYVNYLRPSSETSRAGLMSFIVDTLKSGFGGPDVKNFVFNTEVLTSHAFSKFYSLYQGKAPICVEAQRAAFNGGSAREVFDYGVNEVKIHYFPWTTGVRDLKDAAFTIYDVIDVINAEMGRVNTTPPSNIIKVAVDVKAITPCNFTVIPINNKIRVEGLKYGETLDVYTLSGSLHKSVNVVNDNFEVEVPKGFYIVRSGHNSRKIVVQ